MQHKLPNIKEVFADDNYTSADEMYNLLQTPPNPNWVVPHHIFKEHLYLPIEKVLTQARRIWGSSFSAEVLNVSYMSNCATVTVRCHYFNFDTKQMDFLDGVSACKITNETTAEAAIPIAKSDAIKDAFGVWPLFGSELNKDKKTLSISDKWSDLELLYNSVLPFLDILDIEPLADIIKQKNQSVYTKTLAKLKRLQKVSSKKSTKIVLP